MHFGQKCFFPTAFVPRYEYSQFDSTNGTQVQSVVLCVAQGAKKLLVKRRRGRKEGGSKHLGQQ